MCQLQPSRSSCSPFSILPPIPLDLYTVGGTMIVVLLGYGSSFGSHTGPHLLGCLAPMALPSGHEQQYSHSHASLFGPFHLGRMSCFHLHSASLLGSVMPLRGSGDPLLSHYGDSLQLHFVTSGVCPELFRYLIDSPAYFASCFSVPLSEFEMWDLIVC